MSDKDNNVKAIHTVPNEFKAAIAGFKRALPELLEYQAVLAQVRMASYQAHLAEGFSNEEALFLCKYITGAE